MKKEMDAGVIETPFLSRAQTPGPNAATSCAANATLLHTAARRATAATCEQIHFRGQRRRGPAVFPLFPLPYAKPPRLRLSRRWTCVASPLEERANGGRDSAIPRRLPPASSSAEVQLTREYERRGGVGRDQGRSVHRVPP